MKRAELRCDHIYFRGQRVVAIKLCGRPAKFSIDLDRYDRRIPAIRLLGAPRFACGKHADFWMRRRWTVRPMKAQ